MKKAIGLFALTAVLAVWAGVACSSHDANALSEFAVRNAASVEAARQFKDAGHPIEGNLTCNSTVSGHNIGVQCTGKTTKGEAVTAAGIAVTANHDTALKGQWIGFVAGHQVFRESCIGPTC